MESRKLELLVIPNQKQFPLFLLLISYFPSRFQLSGLLVPNYYEMTHAATIRQTVRLTFS